MKDGDPEICFCVEQFVEMWNIESDDLEALRAIDDELNGVTQTFESENEKIFVINAPNGVQLEFCRSEGESCP